MTIDTETSEPVLQRPYPITMKHYQWVKDEIEKLSNSKGDMTRLIKLVSAHHSCPKRRWRKMLSD